MSSCNALKQNKSFSTRIVLKVRESGMGLQTNVTDSFEMQLEKVEQATVAQC